MVRAVLDANVYVSAYLKPDGPPGKIIEQFLRESSFELVLSPAIVDETLRALTYPKIQKYSRAGTDAEAWFEDLVILSHFIADQSEFPPVSQDRDDDKYLAAAVEARAGFVVSGDADLLTLEFHHRVRIVSPRAFLKFL